jgi:hypothetical protein
MRTQLNSCRLRTARQVRQLLGYNSPSGFWQFVHSAGVPFIRLNSRRIMFDSAAVENWLRHRAVGSHPEPIVTADGGVKGGGQ